MSPVEDRVMLRGVLAIYLAFQSAVGPCAGCCLAARLLASASHCPTTSDCPPASSCGCCSPVNTASGGCQRCAPTGQQPAAPSRCPAPGPSCPSCPCDEPSTCCGALIVKAEQSGLSLLRWLLDAAPGPAWLDGSAAPAAPALVADARTAPALPFLSTSDLLHAHHRLRC